MNEIFILGIASACWLVFAGFIIGFFAMQNHIKSKYKKYVSRNTMNFLLESQEKRLKEEYHIK